MALRTNIKPYKLKASGEAISRDDLNTWKHILLGFIRQNENWTQFLEGEANGTWVCSDKDISNGLVAPPANTQSETDAASRKLRAHFKDFLTCVATYAPQGFGETILRESTSFRWIISLLQRTFGLETKGEHFLALEDVKLEYGPDFTPQQGFMTIKDIVCAGLLEEGSKYEGRELTERELLTPTVKNFITKEWLVKSDTRLPKYVRETRGHLFTAERPTLHCNQQILADQMPTMIAELNAKSEVSQGNINMTYSGERGMYSNVSMGFVRSNQPRMMRPVRNNMGRGLMRGAGTLRNIPSMPIRFTANGCYRCLEATPKRYDAAKTHLVRDCPFPPNQGSTRQPRLAPQYQKPAQPSYRVVLFPDHQVEQQMASLSIGDTINQDQEVRY